MIDWTWLEELLNNIKSVIVWLIDSVIDLVQIIKDLPSYLELLWNETGQVFSIVGDFLSVIPTTLWILIFVSAVIYFITHLLFGKKGG